MKENKKLINIRLTPKEKEQMESLAESCGLSLSEYLRKRGLMFAPNQLNWTIDKKAPCVG